MSTCRGILRALFTPPPLKFCAVGLRTRRAKGFLRVLLICGGLTRRIQHHPRNSADSSATYHYYYFRGWQNLEKRNGSDAYLRQVVWGAPYVNNPVQIGVKYYPRNCRISTSGRENAQFLRALILPQGLLPVCVRR